jgi:deoxyribodipyrimidine photo-lyase
MSKEKISVFWFRRDLRLNDNIGLMAAIESTLPVFPLFIFDSEILEDLPEDDARVTFIHDQLVKLNKELATKDSSIQIKIGRPLEIWNNLLEQYDVKEVYFNHDYEPYALKRDTAIQQLLEANKIKVFTFKDHVFFEKDEILKADGSPYTIYTPYKNKWLEHFKNLPPYQPMDEKKWANRFVKTVSKIPSLEEVGFVRSAIQAPEFNLKVVQNYDTYRDFPAENKTSFIGHHLRFGTVSIRSLVYFASSKNQTFLSELIWRDFFSQILYHFPHVVQQSFKKPYDAIEWENNPEHFEKWCTGKTGYPIVDAGMNQLNQTGFMHNRVRMIVASFLVKHLLIDWRWGEAYFAEKLLDFDLASNNGNWQWAAGCGCDAAPYFRVFSPSLQQEKFDPDMDYIRTWIPDFDPNNYIEPIVNHAFARDRAIKRYKAGIESWK